MRNLLAAAALSFAACSGHAQLSIEITGAGAQRIPVAIVPFVGEGALAGGANAAISAIVRADLERSGLFRGVEVPSLVPAPTEASSVNYAEWKSRLADALVLGSVAARPDGRFEARFRLHDVVKQSSIGGVAYTMSREQLRATAHRIADYVYEKLTGEKGVFSTRIAYVTKAGTRYNLWVADADGENAQSALASSEPIISPAWSANGKQLAYVSFESRKPVVYVHDVATGNRRLIANFRGSNSAPAWAPDGRSLAVTLTRDGGSQIYTIAATGGEARRLTQSGSIDTEPLYTADGRSLYFVSDRGGSPQVYRMPSNGGEPQRVTFTGTYNISPSLSPDGRWLAYISRISGAFKLQVMELATGNVQSVTDTTADESPSFAPNGRLIIYATRQGGAEALMTATLDGKIKARLPGRGGDIREPDWGPFQR